MLNAVDSVTPTKHRDQMLVLKWQRAGCHDATREAIPPELAVNHELAWT